MKPYCEIVKGWAVVTDAGKVRRVKDWKFGPPQPLGLFQVNPSKILKRYLKNNGEMCYHE